MRATMERATCGCHLIDFPQLVLDRTSATPLHRQIRDQIAAAIRNGTIPNNARLPSTRSLAELLGVSRNTAMVAYDDLVADGVMVGKRGSGMRVNRGTRAPAFELAEVFRSAQFPARLVYFQDLDCNPIALNF